MRGGVVSILSGIFGAVVDCGPLGPQQLQLSQVVLRCTEVG